MASKEPISVGGAWPSTRTLHMTVTPLAWWNSKLTPLGPVTVTASSKTLETGASGTAATLMVLLTGSLFLFLELVFLVEGKLAP